MVTWNSDDISWPILARITLQKLTDLGDMWLNYIRHILLIPPSAKYFFSFYSLGFGSKFCVSSRVPYEIPEEGWWTHRPKLYEYNNKDKDNSPNILNNNNYRASFQKFRQIREKDMYRKRKILKCIHTFLKTDQIVNQPYPTWPKQSTDQ